MPCATVQRLKIRLFAEGVEIPCIAMQVQSAPNSPMVASFQIPPLGEAVNFLPRTIIHAFFLDQYEQNSMTQRSGSVAGGKPNRPSVFDQAYREGAKQDGDNSNLTNELVRDRELHQYKLVFVGELMGLQFTKAALSRSVVLQCQDLSNYWDYAVQYNNTDLFGPGMKAMFSGGSTNLFTDFLSEPGGQVVAILMKPPTRYPSMQGLLGGIIHLLEAIGGSYFYDTKYAGQNIFFSLAELRLRITQMVTAFDKDPTAKKLLGGGYDGLFGRSIGNLGEQASYRKIISMLTGVIFHEVYGQPCPMFEIGTAGTQSGFVRKKLRDMNRIGSLATSAEEMGAGVAGVFQSVSAFSLNPLPTTDPSAIATAKAAKLNTKSYEKRVSSTKAKLISDHLSQRLKELEQIRKGCTTLASVAQREISEAKKFGLHDVSEMCKRVSGAFRSAGMSLSYAAQGLRNRSTVTLDSPAQKAVLKHLLEAQELLAKIGSEEASVTKPKDAIPSSLKQQIFRPDVWFSAPPRCNVIFPNQTMQLTYGINFMAAPTRLMLKTNDEFFGEDELFDNFYFAPKVPGLKSKEASLFKTLLNYDIFDHELFTGIVPVFEKMGEFNIFAIRSGQVAGKQPKVGLAQRSANFLYFKYRFAARQLSVTTRFNPYIACGFPGLVIDKHVDFAAMKAHNAGLAAAGKATKSINDLMGVHYLGSFTNVQHSIDQNQGTTNIECSYARVPNEGVEFLGAIQDQIEVLKKKGQVVNEITIVASITPPKVEQLGPQLGRIIEVVDVTSTYADSSTTLASAKVFPLYGGPRDKKDKDLLTLYVPVGVSAPAVAFGKDVVEFVGDPAIRVLFKAFWVKEELPLTKKELVDLDPEEYIRPGWYGDCWHSAKISEVYYQFFGTGAITEPTQVQNEDGNPYKDEFVSSDALTALTDALESGNIPVSPETMITLSQSKSASVNQAVAFLVLTYSILKNGGFDADEFLRSYTWRPIASMLDMFGTVDLEYDENGEEVIHGIEGFHSKAFGQDENLFGLVPSNVESILGIKRGSTIAQKADVRKRRQDAILAYVASLKPGNVILG